MLVADEGGNEEGKQGEADLDPSVLLGSKKRSKLQNYRAALQSKGYLSRASELQAHHRQPRGLLVNRASHENEDEDKDDDDQLLGLDDKLGPEPADGIPEEVVIVDEESKKRRLNTARWRAMMESESKEDESDDESDYGDEDSGYYTKQSNDNGLPYVAPHSALPECGATGKNSIANASANANANIDQDNREPGLSNVSEDRIRVKIKNKAGQNISAKVRANDAFNKLFAVFQSIALDKVRYFFDIL